MKLENGKEGKWSFADKVWIVPPEGEISYIKDWSSGQVLGIPNIVSGTEKLVVLQSEANPLSDNQKWLRSHYDDYGFFTLANPSSEKILTASGVTKLTIKGWLKIKKLIIFVTVLLILLIHLTDKFVTS